MKQSTFREIRAAENIGWRVLAAIVLAPVALLAQPPQGRGGPQTAPAGPMANEKYRNIQVLTNVPADQLGTTMRYVSAAVGMACVECHVQDASGQFSYDKDDKRAKQTARQMMKLVYGINAGNFGVQVECATCHAGHNRPPGLPMAEMLTPEQIAQMNAPAPAPGPGGAGPGRAGGGARPAAPPVDDILNKYFDAVGGRAAVDKIQSLTKTGSLTNRAGQTFPVTISEKGDKFRETEQTNAAPTVRAFDGTTGWVQTGSSVSDLAGFALEQALQRDDAGAVSGLSGKYPALQVSNRPFNINGKETIGVTGRAGATTEQFYFESASGLLVRRVITTRTPLGSLRDQIDYADYRPVGDVKIPFEMKRTTWNELNTLKVSDAKVNPALDDAIFAKPK